MTIRGTSKIDGLVVSEIVVNFLVSPVSIEVTAAFISQKSGDTHGWTKGHGSHWSEETRKNLLALRESMERDIAKSHFINTDAPARKADDSDVGGLGEHLDKTPSL